MTTLNIVQSLRRIAEGTPGINCTGCGYEHNCGTHGCAVMREAADKLNTYEQKNAFWMEDQIYTNKLKNQLKEEREKHRWIPVTERIPQSDRYVLLSFKNYSLPLVGRCETDEEGSAFYIGDETVSCSKTGVFVNAWMELPERYVGGMG